MLQSQIKALEDENKELRRKYPRRVEDAAVYRQQYNANLTRIGELKAELAEWQKKQKNTRCEAGRQTTMTCRRTTTTVSRHHAGPTRLPQSVVAGRRFVERYTFVRKATTPNIDGEITFGNHQHSTQAEITSSAWQDSPCHCTDPGNRPRKHRHVCMTLTFDPTLKKKRADRE